MDDKDNIGQPGPDEQLWKFACLDCRRVFKRAVAGTGSRRYPREIEIRRCPSCGGDAYLMGGDFRAPPRDDLKAWAVVEKLVRAGLPYFRLYAPMNVRDLPGLGIPNNGVTSASYRVGEYPTTLAGVERFIAMYGALAMPFVRRSGSA